MFVYLVSLFLEEFFIFILRIHGWGVVGVCGGFLCVYLGLCVCVCTYYLVCDLVFLLVSDSLVFDLVFAVALRLEFLIRIIRRVVSSCGVWR